MSKDLETTRSPEAQRVVLCPSPKPRVKRKKKASLYWFFRFGTLKSKVHIPPNSDTAAIGNKNLLFAGGSLLPTEGGKALVTCFLSQHSQKKLSSPLRQNSGSLKVNVSLFYF